MTDPVVSRRFDLRRLAPALGTSLALIGLTASLAAPAARAQATTAADAGASSGPTVFNVTAVQNLLARGDAAAASGNLVEARRLYEEARKASRLLLAFYRDLSGAFRGLDARIPREMDDRGRQTLDTLVEANLRLAALSRRQGQPEVAIPLLVEVVKTMTPANESGRKAYQQLVEIGFVTTTYTAPGSGGN